MYHMLWNVSPTTNVGNVIKVRRTNTEPQTLTRLVCCTHTCPVKAFIKLIKRSSYLIFTCPLGKLGCLFFWVIYIMHQHVVQVIESKILQKWSEGKQKLLQVSGKFELSRVQVTKRKITVNVLRKSKGNRLRFELARARVIGSQRYLQGKSRYLIQLYTNFSPPD